MNLLLDAWLDGTEACLRILDRNSGSEILSWRGEQVKNAIENGTICATELEQAQPSDEELLNLVASMGH